MALSSPNSRSQWTLPVFPEGERTRALVLLIDRLAQTDGEHATAVPALHLYRFSAPTAPTPCLYDLSLTITIRGAKRVVLENEVFSYGEGQALMTTVDLPVVSSVAQASAADPFLGIRLRLDRQVIGQVVAELEYLGPITTSPTRGLSLITVDPDLENALVRLLALLEQPRLLPSLAPLVQREIVVRLLSGDQGNVFRHWASSGSPSHQIAKVMNWLKSHYGENVSMDSLASEAFMSPSTFRLHFRAVTGMSPLQYLKKLRLLSARQGMIGDDLDSTTAALRVGYESVSQFTREYARMFGAPPLRDVKRMREASPAQATEFQSQT